MVKKPLFAMVWAYRPDACSFTAPKGPLTAMAGSLPDASLGPQRKALFQKQKEAVENEIRRMEKVLDMIRFKCWYYEQAMIDGNEDRLKQMLPDQLPEEIQVLYDHAHEE